MCLLCKDELLKSLSRKELVSNGLEMISAVKTPEELQHIYKRLMELQKQEKMFALFKEISELHVQRESDETSK